MWKDLQSLPVFPGLYLRASRDSQGGTDTWASQKEEKGTSALSWVSPVEPQHILVRAWCISSGSLLLQDCSPLCPPGTHPQL